ncbi:protein kinase domain-containing protein [Schaalia odontolytica]
MTSGAGRVLGGRYTLLTPIAQGGMGEVWKARDRVSGHIVAAKVLRPELAGEELSLSRLRLEARNSMSISHPNIANTQDSGQEDGIGWIIMELVDGYPLTDYLRGGSRIEPEYLMPILIQVAMALGAAARAGVVHRDIKPANILVRPDGMVKLTDFGISRATGQVNLTAAGMVMGTAQYLPPEQAMGEVATPIGDLYALGVIAYEAAAGRRPFTGETQVDIAFAHVNDPVPPLPDFVPEPLADVILHLLEKDPAKRPESGSAAVREIAAAAKAMGISVTPRPLPLPKAAQRPAEVRTPVQPSVPIVAPVRHLRRRTLPEDMLQPPSGLTPKVRTTTGRHAAVPVLDEATTIAPSSSAIPVTGRHAAVPRVLDEAEVLPTSRPLSAPTQGSPAVAAQASSSTAPASEDRRAALAERLRQRAERRQAEDAAEAERRACLAREEEERRQRELEEARTRREAELAQRKAAQRNTPTIPQPRSEQPRRDKANQGSSPRATTGSTPRVYGTVPQPRSANPSSRPRRSVYEPRPDMTTRGPRWHALDARSALGTRPPAKTTYSRSVVAPPIPPSRQIIRAAVVAIIVIALIALSAITIKYMLGSLIQPSAGAHITEEVRTWQSPWPTV